MRLDWVGVLAGAALVLPLAVPALAEPEPDAVRLDTSMTMLDRSADRATYEITVRPSGGTARDVRLDLTADAPASWDSFSAPCRPSGELRLACALGDLEAPGAVRVTLQVPAPGLGLLAVAEAGNAASQESTVVVPPPDAAPSPSGGPGGPTPGPSPETAQGPSGEPNAGPALGVSAPPVTTGPLGVSPVPVVSELPSGPGVSGWPGTGSGSGAGDARDSVVAGAPSASPRPSARSRAPESPAAPDTSQLSLVTAADVPGGHSAWVRVLGVLLVAEAFVLWLAAGLGLWRRRAALSAGRVIAGSGRLAGRIAASLRRRSFRR